MLCSPNNIDAIQCTYPYLYVKSYIYIYILLSETKITGIVITTINR